MPCTVASREKNKREQDHGAEVGDRARGNGELAEPGLDLTRVLEPAGVTIPSDVARDSTQIHREQGMADEPRGPQRPEAQARGQARETSDTGEAREPR